MSAALGMGAFVALSFAVVGAATTHACRVMRAERVLARLTPGGARPGVRERAVRLARRAWTAVVEARRIAAYDSDLVGGLDAMARHVRSGASLRSAVADAGDAAAGLVAVDLRRVAGAVRRGERLDNALDAWRSERDRAAVHLVVAAIALAANTGGPPARVIEDLATSLRTRLQIEGEARAMAAQARLSAVVVGVAPIAFALFTSAIDPHNAHLLFGTPIGLVCLVVGLALDAVGAVWMHRISSTVLA